MVDTGWTESGHRVDIEWTLVERGWTQCGQKEDTWWTEGGHKVDRGWTHGR